MVYRKTPTLLLFAGLETGNDVKRQKLRTGDHETLDTAVFKWFLSLRSQNVQLSSAIIQEKASQICYGDVDGRRETTNSVVQL